MNPIHIAWITAFLYGISSIVAKIAANRSIRNPWLYNFIWTLLGFMLIVPVCVYFGIGLPSHWESVLYMGLMSAASGTTYILAMNAVDVSVLSPFYMLRTPIIVILGFLLFGEVLSVVQIVWITVMLMGGVFVSFDESLSLRSFFRPQLRYAILSILTSALYNISVKYAAERNSFWDMTFWTGLLTVIFILPTYTLFIKDLRKTSVSSCLGIFWSTVFGTTGLLLSFIALKDSVGIASAIISLPFSMLLAMLLSVIAPSLLESHTWKVYAIRLLAATIMFLCAMQLSAT